MPLSQPVEREPIHLRAVTCRGYRRSDGLWDIEGALTDTKAYAFANEYRGTMEPGDPIHGMWIRLTVDDQFVVRAIEAVTDHGPFPICDQITPNFQQLVGLAISAGWTRAVKERLGGVRGCTHLVELLGPVATTAFQTIYPILARERAEHRKTHPEEPPLARPVLLDTCHVFDSNGDYVKRHWPDHYTGP